MTEFKFNEDEYRGLLERIGAQVGDIVNATAQQTAELSTVDAIDVLHARLGAVEGMTFDRAWSCNVIETLRRGEDLNIEIS